MEFLKSSYFWWFSAFFEIMLESKRYVPIMHIIRCNVHCWWCVSLSDRKQHHTGTQFTLVVELIRAGSKVVRPNEPDQPDLTQPEFGPWWPNPTQLNPNLDTGDPTRPKIAFKLGSFGFSKYSIGLNLNLNSIWGQPNWTRFLTLGANRTLLNPNFLSKIGSQPQKMGRV